MTNYATDVNIGTHFHDALARNWVP